MSREGTKGHNLPIVFFVIGPYCFLVALCVALKQSTCPRKAGSANIIRDWTQHADGGSRNLYLGRFEDEGESSSSSSGKHNRSKTESSSTRTEMNIENGYVRAYSPPGVDAKKETKK